MLVAPTNADQLSAILQEHGEGLIDQPLMSRFGVFREFRGELGLEPRAESHELLSFQLRSFSVRQGAHRSRDSEPSAELNSYQLSG
jgi:hypothetical protein